MRKQTFDRIKKTMVILLAVFLIATLTVASASACSKNLKPVNKLGNNLDYNLGNNLGNNWGNDDLCDNDWGNKGCDNGCDNGFDNNLWN